MSEESTVNIFGSASDKFGLLDEKSRSSINVSVLKQNLDDFMAKLKDILPASGGAVQGLPLTSIAVAVGVDAKGQLGFLGTGAEVGGNATLTLTFGK